MKQEGGRRLRAGAQWRPQQPAPCSSSIECHVDKENTSQGSRSPSDPTPEQGHGSGQKPQGKQNNDSGTRFWELEHLPHVLPVWTCSSKTLQKKVIEETTEAAPQGREKPIGGSPRLVSAQRNASIAAAVRVSQPPSICCPWPPVTKGNAARQGSGRRLCRNTQKDTQKVKKVCKGSAGPSAKQKSSSRF